MSSLIGSNYGTQPGFQKNKIPTGYKEGRIAQFTPEQMQLFQMLFGGASAGLKPGLEHLSGLAAGKPETFEALERPAMRQFSELLGGIGSKFSGMGTGARKSSGFGLATSAAGQQLAEKLQSQRLGLQNQAIQQLLGLSGTLMQQRPYENFFVKNPWLELGGNFISGAGEGFGKAAGATAFA